MALSDVVRSRAVVFPGRQVPAAEPSRRNAGPVDFALGRGSSRLREDVAGGRRPAAMPIVSAIRSMSRSGLDHRCLRRPRCCSGSVPMTSPCAGVHPSRIKVCYEAAGFVGRCAPAGCREVIAPSLIPRASGDKVKTDRRDAAEPGDAVPRAPRCTSPPQIEACVTSRKDDLQRAQRRLLTGMTATGRTGPEARHLAAQRFTPSSTTAGRGSFCEDLRGCAGP